MTKIYNFSPHESTQEQLEAGLVEPYQINKEYLRDLHTFNKIPTCDTLMDRAIELAKVVDAFQFKHILIGGAPFFMPYLTKCLKEKNCAVYFDFSRRESFGRGMEYVSSEKRVGFVKL